MRVVFPEPGFAFRGWGLEFGVWGFEFGVWHLEFGVWGLGIRVWGFGCGMWGFGFRVYQEGLVFNAHRLVYHSTLGLRVINKRCTEEAGDEGHGGLLRIGQLLGLIILLQRERVLY